MKIEKKRFSEEIAHAIQRKIEDLELCEGDRLPSHASLAEELNVSIPSLREGLQALATLGVLKISHGVGTIVTRPKVSDYFKILNPVLLSKQRAKEEYIEVCSIHEPSIALVIIKNGGEYRELNDSLEMMSSIAGVNGDINNGRTTEERKADTDEKRDIDAFISHYLQFHRRMAKLGGNSVITEILSIVNHLLFAQPAVRNSIRRNMNTIVHHHMNFIKALEKKDSLLAEQSMKECLSLLGQQGGVAIVYDTFSTGSIGGSFYSAGRELCRILNEYGGMPIESEPSGGGIENVELTSEGKAVLGLTQSDIAFHAFNGTNPFFEPHEQIRAVCGAHQLDLWIVVSASSPLFNLNDLHGKRIAMGALGGESSLIAKALLDVYGYTDGDYRSFYLSISNAVNGMLHSEIDAIFYLSGGPGSALNELSENIPLRFLSIDETHTNSILKTHPYWKKSIIKKDSWPDLKEDVPTLSISSLLITHKDVPNQIIKIITSVIMEHAEEINFDYINGTSYGINNALQGIPIPLHPGAEEYYRGNGLEL